MNVLFFSRETIKRILPIGENGHIAIISVNDDLSDMVDMSKLITNSGVGVDHFQTFVFHDACDETSGFTPEAASIIVNFIDKCNEDPDIKIMWVHCLMGISRSAAIAKFINTYLGLGITELDDYTMHNMFVYETLCKAAGIETLKQYYKSLESE